MANRGSSAAFQAEAIKAANKPIHLVALYLDGASTFATDAYRTITWGGDTYAAVSHFLGFDGLEETSDLSVTQTRVSLAGVDQSLIAGVLQHAYLDRRLVIRKGFLDDADNVIVDPVPILDGRCDAPVIEEDPVSGKCMVTLAVSAQWVDFERKPGRHTNHDEEQIWFPGDMGFQYISQLNREIKWGAG